MNKVFFALLIISMVACSRTHNTQQDDSRHGIDEIQSVNQIEAEVQDDLNITMYVNALDGLRVRNAPDIAGERIGVLDYNTKVNVIRENNDLVTIDGINGKWVYITAGDIEGWVFNGYLSDEPQEYIIYYSGMNTNSGSPQDFSGTVSVRRQTSGKITISPAITEGDPHIEVSRLLIPFLPENFFITSNIRDIVIDGNTTITTYTDGRWIRIDIDGNTTTEISPEGVASTTVVSGNVTEKNYPSGAWVKIVVEGNTTTITKSYLSPYAIKIVKEGNTETAMYSPSAGEDWVKRVIDGSTETITSSLDFANRTMVIDGDIITIMHGDIVTLRIEKKGTAIYIHEIDEWARDNSINIERYWHGALEL